MSKEVRNLIILWIVVIITVVTSVAICDRWLDDMNRDQAKYKVEVLQ